MPFDEEWQALCDAADRKIRDPRDDVIPATNGDARLRPLAWLDMLSWDHEPIPEREWAILNRVPLNQAGLLSGEGGTGKSIIELTKDVAHVAGKDWFGSLPERGPAIYIGAEDDEKELHIRLAAIAKHYGVTFEELIAGGLHVLCLLGQDATLCAASGKSGRVEVTAFITNSTRPQATSNRRTSASTRRRAPSPEARSTACRSMPSPCTCRRSRWWPAVPSRS